MNDSDLEDIESQLYSQIYHSNDQSEENLNILTTDNFEQPSGTMKKPNRYFQHNKKNSIFSNKHSVRYESSPKSALQTNCTQTEGIYSKECTRPHKRDISINQVVVLNAQQPTAIVCLTSSEKKKSKLSKWKAKWLAKKKEKKKARAMAKLSKSQQNDIVNEKQKPEENDIITVSDSDDESCVEIANNWPTLALTDSEDEEIKNKRNEKLDASDNSYTATQTVDAVDDVIFVEPPVVPVEVINIDEETDNSPQKMLEGNIHTDMDTASVASSNSFINSYSANKSQSVRNTHQERKELLSTPDSTSNDFMNNSGIQLQKDVFSFSLHGSDFNNDKFVNKANTSTEQCATESSSSTTDPNALNTIKTVVFNEIDFPKEGVFSEANLESFGNFITPLRKKVGKKISQNSTPVENLSPVPSQNVYSSGTSSESDFGESGTDETPKKTKYLPDLSPMNNSDIASSLQAVKKLKKVKKTSSLSSKYDLIGADLSEIASKDVKQKKRKSSHLNETPLDTDSSKKKNKNKKKKTDKGISRAATKGLDLTTEESSTVVNSTTESTNEDQQTGDPDDNVNKEETANETKRKKKKYREEAEESSDSSHSRKKSKTKKKKISVLEADQTSENPSADLAQQDCGNQDQEQDKVDHNVENVGSSNTVSATVVTEIQFSELLLSNSDIKTEKDTEKSEQQLHLEVVSTVHDLPVKIEQDTTPQIMDQHSENRDNSTSENVRRSDKNIGAGVTNDFSELPEEFVVIDEVAQGKSEVQVISSDNDSNLSALDGQHDIQLVNCKENISQKHDGNVNERSDKKPDVDLIRCSLEEVQRAMSNDPKLWTILDSDRMPLVRNMGRRCNRCREKGHMAVRCPNVVVAKCRLCGERGHYEPRCPNRICTQCGSRSPYSTTTCRICFQYRTRVCELCFMVGHPSTACPDLWRRYHLTTSEGPLKPSNGPLLKPKSKLWCSGCARPGHLEYTCRYYKSMYPPTDPRIKCYEDVYQDNRNCQRPNVELQQVIQPLLFGVGNYALMQRNNQNNVQMNSYVDSRPYMNDRRCLPQFEQNPIPMTHSLPYHNTNNYPPQSHNQQEFFFEDNLPNFISFEPPPASSNYVSGSNNCRYFNNRNGAEVQNENVVSNVDNVSEDQQRGTKQNARIFFSGTAEKIFNLINYEMRKLSKMSVMTNKVVKDLRRQQLTKAVFKNKQNYIKTLNMVLFGIYKMKEGAKHLVKLKNFKMQRLKSNKLSQERRKDLYTSYCYIFGISKHNGIDYWDLLRQI